MNNIVLIVLNYNDYSTTCKFINSVKNYNNIDKIVVVDNNSPDESYEKLLKHKDSKVDVIKSDKNGGYAYGNNFGIKYAINEFDPKYIIISNPDVFFEEDIIDSMKDIYVKEERVGIVAPTMIIKGEIQWTSWRLPSFKDDLISLSHMLGRVFEDKTIYPKDYFKGDYSEVDVLPGSLFMIPTKVMAEIGFFDEDVFLYCEERMLSKRLLERGYKNIILNNKVYDHQHSISIGKSIDDSIKIYKIMADSMYIYQVKYEKINFMKRIIFKTLVNIMILRMKLG
jgi:GT2 family glycosyltransferase